MSVYMSRRFDALEAYVPGEQPRDRKYIKLNTNESPFPPSPAVLRAIAGESESLNLYPDPEVTALRRALAERYGVGVENVLPVNGSDEALSFSFMAFCDGGKGAVFPNISYGFYPVFARLYGVPYRELPLGADMSIDVDSYLGAGAMVVIANPNAPTGVLLPVREIERIAAGNPDSVVIVDEAYIDFGGESAIPLTKKYENLLVVQTYSKSRSLAGARLGYAIGSQALISDLNLIKYSTNPYNINRLTCAAGVAAIEDRAYYDARCAEIIAVRERSKRTLGALGFVMTDSRANFLFATHPALGGAEYYEKLRGRGILVRHFSRPEIDDYVRITVGTQAQMDRLADASREILEEKA